MSHSERALPLEGLIRIERLQDSLETNFGREVTMNLAAENACMKQSLYRQRSVNLGQ